MANYAVDYHRTASAVASLGSIAADATRPRRGEIYDILVGCEAAAADNPFLYVLQRFTAAGTSTAVVPSALDPADAATEADAGENHTAEPTYTGVLFLLMIPLNQRATFRWIATEGGRLVYPATASNGIGIATPTSSAVAVTATLHFCER
jgi:hypothetical protein